MILLARRVIDKNRFGKAKSIIKSILFGATVFDMAQDTLKMRSHVEHALMLVSIGDMLGLPVISYYRLRLLPYWIHIIQIWKTAVLREKDVTERILS